MIFWNDLQYCWIESHTVNLYDKTPTSPALGTHEEIGQRASCHTAFNSYTYCTHQHSCFRNRPLSCWNHCCVFVSSGPNALNNPWSPGKDSTRYSVMFPSTCYCETESGDRDIKNLPTLASSHPKLSSTVRISGYFCKSFWVGLFHPSLWLAPALYSPLGGSVPSSSAFRQCRG